MGNEISEHPSSLALLVDEFSYRMFDRIGLEEQRISDWFSLPLSICLLNLFLKALRIMPNL